MAKKKVDACGVLNNKEVKDLNSDQLNKLKDFHNLKAEVKHLEVCFCKDLKKKDFDSGACT